VKIGFIATFSGPADTINAIKQAGEFGLKDGGQSLVAFLLFINDVHSIGL
jgi:branched-chain amino acid transport system substrate-binding protein